MTAAGDLLCKAHDIAHPRYTKMCCCLSLSKLGVTLKIRENMVIPNNVQSKQLYAPIYIERELEKRWRKYIWLFGQHCGSRCSVNIKAQRGPIQEMTPTLEGLIGIYNGTHYLINKVVNLHDETSDTWNMCIKYHCVNCCLATYWLSSCLLKPIRMPITKSL